MNTYMCIHKMGAGGLWHTHSHMRLQGPQSLAYCVVKYSKLNNDSKHVALIDFNKHREYRSGTELQEYIVLH